MILRRWDMARIGKAEGPYRVCRFYHCASVPPGQIGLVQLDESNLEGMSIQAAVSH